MSCNSASKAHLDRQSGLSSFLPGTRRMGWGGGGAGGDGAWSEVQPSGRALCSAQEEQADCSRLDRVLRMKCGLLEITGNPQRVLKGCGL